MIRINSEGFPLGAPDKDAAAFRAAVSSAVPPDLRDAALAWLDAAGVDEADD